MVIAALFVIAPDLGTRMSTNRWMLTQIMVYPYYRILLNNKEMNYWSMQQPGWITMRLSEKGQTPPQEKEYTLYDFIYAQFWKMKTSL
jgi:hypothetical protein